MESIMLLGGFVTGIAWLGTLFRVHRRRRLDLVDWFVLALGGLGGVGFALVIWATYSGLNPLWSKWILDHSEYYWVLPSLWMIATLGVWFGAIVGRAVCRRRVSRLELSSLMVRRISRLAWVLLGLAVVAYWVYARPYGGFVGLLRYSRLIRAGLFDQIGISNPWAFLHGFGALALFSAFLFYALLLDRHFRRKRGQVSRLLGLVLSLAFSSYVLYSKSGRLAIAVYCAIFVLGPIYYYSAGRLRIRTLVGMGTVVLAMIAALFFLSQLITPGAASLSFPAFYARELSFPTVSFFAAVRSEQLRFGLDLLPTPLYLLPERVWRGVFQVTTASDVNTERVLGHRKGEGGVTGEIPTDIITFSYMQLGVVGVAAAGVLWGMILVWLESVIMRLPGAALRAVMYAYSALVVSALTVLYADPRHIMQRNPHFIVGIAALFLITSRVRVRSSKGRAAKGTDETTCLDTHA